jgi:Zn-dependent alcohol dehydrogenase
MFIKKTKAAILVKQKKPLVIDTIILPKKLKVGQVLVELIYSGICGSQLGEIEGVKGPDKFLPHLLGHEGIASVLEVGPGVKKVRKNDRVLLHWMPSSGINSQNPNYFWKNKKLNAGLVTTFNEHCIVSENRITKIKKNFDTLSSLLLGCTASTALSSVFKLSKVAKNSVTAVSGCGAIGLYVIKILNYLKVKDIIAIDLDNKKLNLAKKYGASFLLNNKSRSIDVEIKKKFIKGVDYFFECSGNSEVISQAFKALHKEGSEILIGVPSFKEEAKFYTLDINLGKKIIGSKGGNFNPDKDFLSYSQIINKEEFNNNSFIYNKIKLDDINQLFSDMRKSKIIGKSIIVY